MRASILLLLLLLGFTTGQTDTVDQNALIALWNGFSSKGSLSWNTEASLCGQTGVTCTSTKVTKLSIPTEMLQGTIATQIGALTSLTELNLGGEQFRTNSLSGTIPTQIGWLTSLTQLYLGWNSLSGSIPTQIASLTSLTNLYLGGNSLSGSIPTQIASLTSLTNLNLDWNSLSGSIPTQIGSLTSLVYLFLNSNSLSGNIPTQIGTMSNLFYLYLGWNSLSGSIPTQIASLTSLAILNLGRNSLSGSIPTQIGTMSNLFYLFLYSNSLSGSIPTQIGTMSNLTLVYLHENSLSGSIPTQIGSLISLTVLYLHANSLSGTIPTQIGSLTRLTDLFLHNNHLSGTIPTELGAREFYKMYLIGTNHFCPLANYSGWAEDHDSPSNLTCTACGASFPLCQSEEICLGGVNEAFTCGTAGCPPQTLHRYATWPQTTFGTVASGTCVKGYSGSPTRLCRADRTWETTVQNECTRSVCPTVEEGGFIWPSRQSGNIVNFLCPTGFSGRPTRTCLDPGVWSPIENPCTEKGCPAVASYQNAVWPQTPRGQVATGTCAQGYSGTITRNCKVEGYWSPTVQGSCARDKCAADMSENATWPSTTAGLTAMGTCDAGFSGAPTRVCQTDASWGTVQNPCSRNQCPASSADEGAFAATDSLITTTGTCLLPFKGAPTRSCRADGTWGAIVSPCSLDCPASAYGRATWPTSSGSRYATGTCDLGYQGTPRRFCNQDGTWSANIMYTCARTTCDAVSEEGLEWPQTFTGNWATATCPSGRMISRLCSLDGSWRLPTRTC